VATQWLASVSRISIVEHLRGQCRRRPLRCADLARRPDQQNGNTGTAAVIAALVCTALISTSIDPFAPLFAANAALYQVREVKPHVFVWVPDDVIDQDGDPEFSRAGTAGFIIAADGVIVIDTTNSPAHARELLYEIRRRTELPVRYVINTDVDGEHTLGNEVFIDEQAAIISTIGVQAAVRAYRESLSRRLRGDWRLEVRMRGFHPTPPGQTFNGELVLRPEAAKDEIGPHAAATQLANNAPGDVFQDEIRLIQLVGPACGSTLSSQLAARQPINSAPGTVAGANRASTSDVAVYLPKSKVLFLGDRFESLYYPRFGMGPQSRNINEWVESLGQLESWNVDVYVPGHGEPGGKKELAQFRQFLEWLRSEIDTRIKEGKSLVQIEQELKPRLESYHWHAPELILPAIDEVYDQLAPRTVPAASPGLNCDFHLRPRQSRISRESDRV
jgi:glyoxylase-like metal-dependent hydrolase (beta-lactamase superfamily II)